ALLLVESEREQAHTGAFSPPLLWHRRFRVAISADLFDRHPFGEEFSCCRDDFELFSSGQQVHDRLLTVLTGAVPARVRRRCCAESPTSRRRWLGRSCSSSNRPSRLRPSATNTVPRRDPAGPWPTCRSPSPVR